MASESLLDAFPPTRYAFAYGSAVFAQSGYSAADIADAMTDLVFVVDDPAAWHRQNLAANRSHYSALAMLGPDTVASVQDRFGGRIYYNTHARVRGRLIKYGVISTDAIREDLQHWSSLYVSGRMHKPVRVLRPDAKLQLAVARNLRSALAASLLLLPTRFDDVRMLEAICGLSYAGDVRMGVGESWHKVDNIVAGQAASLRELYAAPLAAEGSAAAYGAVVGPEHLLGGRRDGASAARASLPPSLEQDVTLPARRRLLASLPLCAQAGMLEHLAASGLGAVPGHAAAAGSGLTAAPLATAEAAAAAVPARLGEAAELLWERSRSAEEANARLATSLRHSLSGIVRRASAAQTLKGALTAGVLRSAAYAFAKVSKRLKATPPPAAGAARSEARSAARASPESRGA